MNEKKAVGCISFCVFVIIIMCPIDVILKTIPYHLRNHVMTLITIVTERVRLALPIQIVDRAVTKFKILFSTTEQRHTRAVTLTLQQVHCQQCPIKLMDFCDVRLECNGGKMEKLLNIMNWRLKLQKSYRVQLLH